MPSSHVGRRDRFLRHAEQLEYRCVLSATSAASFTTGLDKTAADRPWMTAAADGTSGAAVIWMRVDVSGGVPAIQTLPIWGRFNPADSIDPALSGDATDVFAGMDASVFSGTGTDIATAGPLTLDEFAASAASWHEGVQDYFVVIRSPSDLAITVVTAGFVLAGAPGLPAPTAGDASANPPAITASGSGTATTNEISTNEVSTDALGAMLALARRPVPQEGLLPADQAAAAWLQDARSGSTGGFVLWLSPSAASDQLPRMVPLFARFNPQTDQDPAFGPPEDHHASASFHPADGSDPIAVPVGEGGFDSWPGSDPAVAAGGFLVVHTDSNFEISLMTVLSILTRVPSAWLNSDGSTGGPDVMSGLSGLSVAAGLGGPPAAPTVSLAHDTGSSPTDGVTSDGRLAVSTVPGAQPQYSTDGGRRWTNAFRPHEGRNEILVRQVDSLGRRSDPTSFTFTLDSKAPPRPAVVLAGHVAGGGSMPLRRQADLSVSRVQRSARIEYSVNGGPWASTCTTVEGRNSVRVRQVDVAGNASPASSPLRFQIKTRVDAPRVALARDTGPRSTDRITSDPRLALGGVERGAVVWYSSDDGQTWQRNFSAAEGSNVVLVRQVDRLGNVSAATRFEFTLDRTPPANPVVQTLSQGPSGSSPQLRVTGVETGCRVEYSIQGQPWTESWDAPSRRNAVALRVRVVDQAGNASPAVVTTFRRTA